MDVKISTFILLNVIFLQYRQIGNIFILLVERNMEICSKELYLLEAKAFPNYFSICHAPCIAVKLKV